MLPTQKRVRTGVGVSGLGWIVGRKRSHCSLTTHAPSSRQRETANSSLRLHAHVLGYLPLYMPLDLSRRFVQTALIASSFQLTQGAHYGATMWFTTVCALTVATAALIYNLMGNVFVYLEMDKALKQTKERTLLYGVDVTNSRFFKDELVLAAVEFAAEAHKGQFRKTGEPYVSHCIETALIVEHNLPPGRSDDDRCLKAMVTAVLHDVIDDTDVELSAISKAFGSEVAEMVCKVSKLSQMNQLLRRGKRKGWAEYTQKHFKDLRQMMVDMVVAEPLVILVKLADRLHNLRTCWVLQPDKAASVAEETQEVWCSMAESLGWDALKSEMEDLCFAVLQPEVYTQLRVGLDKLWNLPTLQLVDETAVAGTAGTSGTSTHSAGTATSTKAVTSPTITASAHAATALPAALQVPGAALGTAVAPAPGNDSTASAAVTQTRAISSTAGNVNRSSTHHNPSTNDTAIPAPQQQSREADLVENLTALLKRAQDSITALQATAPWSDMTANTNDNAYLTTKASVRNPSTAVADTCTSATGSSSSEGDSAGSSQDFDLGLRIIEARQPGWDPEQLTSWLDGDLVISSAAAQSGGSLQQDFAWAAGSQRESSQLLKDNTIAWNPTSLTSTTVSVGTSCESSNSSRPAEHDGGYSSSQSSSSSQVQLGNNTTDAGLLPAHHDGNVGERSDTDSKDSDRAHLEAAFSLRPADKPKGSMASRSSTSQGPAPPSSSSSSNQAAQGPESLSLIAHWRRYHAHSPVADVPVGKTPVAGAAVATAVAVADPEDEAVAGITPSDIQRLEAAAASIVGLDEPLAGSLSGSMTSMDQLTLDMDDFSSPSVPASQSQPSTAVAPIAPSVSPAAVAPSPAMVSISNPLQTASSADMPVVASKQAAHSSTTSMPVVVSKSPKKLILSPAQQRLKTLISTVVPFDAVSFKNLKGLAVSTRRGLEVLNDCASVLYRETQLRSQCAGLQLNIQGRLKSCQSVYRKMVRKGVPVSQVYDARALRVIVDDEDGAQRYEAIEGCYRLMRVIQTIWKPIAKEYDDYIANPKPSGYQALHTAVKGPGGIPMEIQIKTSSMHYLAEYGAAAHWVYKEYPPLIPSSAAGKSSTAKLPPGHVGQPVLRVSQSKLRYGVILGQAEREGSEHPALLVVVRKGGTLRHSPTGVSDYGFYHALLQHAVSRGWSRAGEGDLLAHVEKFVKCNDGRYHRLDHMGIIQSAETITLLEGYDDDVLAAQAGPSTDPSTALSSMESSMDEDDSSLDPVQEKFRQEISQTLQKTQQLRAMIEWGKDTIGKYTPAQGQNDEVSVVIWPSGYIQHYARGTTVGDIVREKGVLHTGEGYDGYKVQLLVNVNNRLVSEDTVINDGDLVILSRERMKI